LLLQREVVICCGTGGVGKTTISAAIALFAAQHGRRALVCTIDPAKRLANSLGISEIGNEETEVSRQRFADHGLTINGSLWAMMLDTKRTFDRLIERYSPSEKIRDEIFDNRFYQSLTNQLSGTQEYSAMEKLYELYTEGRYDLLVLDTPPSKYAVDFLKAPTRVTNFLEGNVIKWFVKPYFSAGRVGFNLFKKGTRVVLEWLEDLFGLQLLKDISVFFQIFSGLYDGFRERAEQVKALLRQREATAFFLVSGSSGIAVEGSRAFLQELRSFRMPVEAVIVNRVHRNYLQNDRAGRLLGEVACSPERMGDVKKKIERAVGRDKVAASMVGKLVENFINFQGLAEADESNVRLLRSDTDADMIFKEIPCFDTDVYELGGLSKINHYLFEGSLPGSQTTMR
jgi:anion-transporting  ArsA/GET3 family ATPase